MSSSIFSHYQKVMLFGQQCQTEWALAEEWLLVHRKIILASLAGDFKLADQLKENFKLLAYREWKESFRKIDRFGGALWRSGLE